MKEAKNTALPIETKALVGLKRADFFAKSYALVEQAVGDDFGNEKARQDLWRLVALDAIDRGDDLGFTPEELTILKSGLRIALVMDNVYSRYKTEMVESELGKRLKNLSRSDALQWLEDRGLTNPYTVYEEKEGEAKQIPYALAFKEEYVELDSEVTKLIENLVALPSSSQPFIPYFQAYRRALMETDIDRLEERWREVDMLWMDVKGPFQPVHAMESYSDPTRTRIDPEFRIVIDDDRAKVVNEQAKSTQEALIQNLSVVFGGYYSFLSSRPAIENSMPLAGTVIVMCGLNLDFRSAGQNVPNRTNVKVEKGVKIFMDLKTFEIRSKEAREALVAVFGEEFAALYYQDPDYRIAAGVLTAGHEFNHNSFVTPETDSLLKNKNLVEETKADLGPFVSLRLQLQRGEIDLPEAQRIVAITLAKCLRIFRIKNRPGQKPYYTASVVEFKLLKEAGVIEKVDSHWAYDLSFEKITKFFELAQEALKSLANAYSLNNQEDIERFLHEYSTETPEILELVNKLKPISS